MDFLEKAIEQYEEACETLESAIESDYNVKASNYSNDMDIIKSASFLNSCKNLKKQALINIKTAVELELSETNLNTPA